MNWPRIILDGLAMSLLFNAVAGLGFLLVPQAYSTMFPKEIRQAAAPFVEKKDVRTMKLILYPLYLVLFVYWAVSAHFAGMAGFRNLFWTPVSAVSGAVCLLGGQRAFCGNDRLWEPVLGGLCGNDHGEPFRFHHPRLLAAAKG